MLVEVLGPDGKALEFDLKDQNELTRIHLARLALRDVWDDRLLQPEIEVGSIRYQTSLVLPAVDKLLSDAREAASEKSTLSR